MGTFFKELRHATCRVWSSSTCGCSSLFAFCRPCLSLLRAKMFRVQSAHEIGAERGGASTRHRLPVHHRICGPDPECIFLRLPCWVPTLDALGVQKNAFGVTWFMARDEAFRVVSVNNVGRLLKLVNFAVMCAGDRFLRDGECCGLRRVLRTTRLCACT